MPRRSKYEPLRAFLASRPPDVTEVTLTLGELETLLGAALPPTARLGAFWTNYPSDITSTVQSRAWREAGWRVAGLRRGGWDVAVTFTRRTTAAR